MVTEITCRSALSPCGLKGIAYSLSAYRGCGFGCRFCYSPAVLHETREWGTFLEAKANIPDILRVEVRKKKKGLVWLSSVTDPYQPAEERYELTKRCLQVLKGASWPVLIQTRSTLVVRDAELISGFERADVGFSVSTLNEEHRRIFEPGSAPSRERFRAMRALSDRGIRTWLFLGPVLPGITAEDVSEIVALAANSGAKALQFDRLRFRPGVWERLSKAIPEALRQEFISARDQGSSYFTSAENQIGRECERLGIPIEPAF